MSVRQFSIGSIQFGTDPTSANSAMQVPNELAVPRRMLGSVHEIPQTDGSPAKLVAQTFGVVFDQITFTARFSGPTMQADIDAMDALHAQQAVVPFSSGSTTFDVIVWNFTPKTVGASNDTVYELTLQPLLSRRSSLTSTTPDASLSYDSQVQALGQQMATAPVVT